MPKPGLPKKTPTEDNPNTENNEFKETFKFNGCTVQVHIIFDKEEARKLMIIEALDSVVKAITSRDWVDWG